MLVGVIVAIPDYYWHDNGQFRGNLKLQRWQDYGEDPNIRGNICTYGGSEFPSIIMVIKGQAHDTLV